MTLISFIDTGPVENKPIVVFNIQNITIRKSGNNTFISNKLIDIKNEGKILLCFSSRENKTYLNVFDENIEASVV